MRAMRHRRSRRTLAAAAAAAAVGASSPEPGSRPCGVADDAGTMKSLLTQGGSDDGGGAAGGPIRGGAASALSSEHPDLEQDAISFCTTGSTCNKFDST